MIVPDANLLIYAYHEEDPSHLAALRWWDSLIAGSESVGIPWVVSTAFVRVITNPSALTQPLTPSQAVTSCASGSSFRTSRRSTRAPNT